MLTKNNGTPKGTLFVESAFYIMIQPGETQQVSSIFLS